MLSESPIDRDGVVSLEVLDHHVDTRTRLLLETSTHPLHAAVYQAAKKRPAMEVVYYSRTVGRQDDV